MTYPDGEVVDYTYNRAGNLQSMQGKKESHTYDYIKQLAYDEFEQRKYLKYGNDTETHYNYDPTMRRLQQLQVSSSLGRQIMNNSYNYDLVGNVLGIKNVAPIVNNTLGGTSNHEYQYDDFYRLKSAKAVYQGEFTKASYELNMSYNKMHNITKKDLVHTVNNEQKGYVLDYNYDNDTHPNAPSTIAEVGKSEPRQYVYDGNGNPTSYTEEKSFRKMTWDEENRLMGINDSGRIHQYTYDAGGERVIKSSGDSQHVAMNGQTAATIVHTDDYTGYVSPYFVISKGKFTKHYFEGAGRIVSKLGNGAFAQPLGITAGGVNYTQRTAAEQKALDNYVRTLGVPPGPPTQQGIYATPEFTGDPYPTEVLKPVEENQEPPEGWPRNPVFNAPGDVPGPPVQFGPAVEPATVQAAEGFTGIGLPENDIFYFHPDHLGSTSYISTRNGSISQHVEYIAFGEVLFEEHSSSFSSPYLFNGKELDRETNLSYYGARYLDMKTSLWLSLDKEGENDLSVGGYVYSFNNPINFTDPDGNWPDLPSWGNSLVNRVKSAAKSYVAHKIDNLVANSRNYVNQKINSVKASISKTISKIENYEGGGYMLSNGSGGSSGDQSLIRKGGRTDVEMVDASGLVQAGSFASSKRDGIKYNGSVKMTLKLVKETVKGVRIGDKVAGKFDANNDSGMSSTSADESSVIDMKLEDNNATGTIGWTESVVNTKTRDTTVNKSQKGIIDKMNKLNRMRAEQKAKTDNAELQKKINYYKE